MQTWKFISGTGMGTLMLLDELCSEPRGKLRRVFKLLSKATVAIVSRPVGGGGVLRPRVRKLSEDVDVRLYDWSVSDETSPFEDADRVIALHLSYGEWRKRSIEINPTHDVGVSHLCWYYRLLADYEANHPRPHLEHFDMQLRKFI